MRGPAALQNSLTSVFVLALLPFQNQNWQVFRPLSPAGKFCVGFRAKMTGGQVNGKQHSQLFPGQKTDKSRTEISKNVPHRQWLARKKDRRVPLFSGGSAGLFCQYTEKYYTLYRKVQQKTSAFLPRYSTRKDPVFSDRVLVTRVNKKDILRQSYSKLCPQSRKRSRTAGNRQG